MIKKGRQLLRTRIKKGRQFFWGKNRATPSVTAPDDTNLSDVTAKKTNIGPLSDTVGLANKPLRSKRTLVKVVGHGCLHRSV